MKGGRYKIAPFDSVSVALEGSGTPGATASKILILQLHGSGGQNTSTGRQYDAIVSNDLAVGTYNTFRFSLVNSTDTSIVLLRPVDQYGLNVTNSARRESMWMGFKNTPNYGSDVALVTQRRLESLMKWASTNVPCLPNKTCLTGGSMGGWGTMTFGIRRKHLFAAIYPDRPRWRYSTIGNVAVANWLGALETVPVANSPFLSPEDGGGKVSVLQDCIAYVSNTSNKIPWLGWCCGRQDGFVVFQENIDAVNALRTAKRGFAFAWNNGDHSTGSIMAEITGSYPYGTFTIGKGYPLFTEHSGDQDPNVDLVGGINIGLSFRNVVETSSGWSCEVTSKLGSRTVMVEPISDVFLATVTPQLVTIPSANTWVSASFTV
jgi:hypothetical protein